MPRDQRSHTRRVEAGVRGRLSVASPIELGQFFLLGRKTGSLHLVRDDQRGVLYFLDGNVVAAVGPNLRSGEEAAMEILTWESGEFHFVPEPVADVREITVGTQNLLLETARSMDESGAGEAEVATRLREVDELTQTFAAISEARHQAGSGPRSDARVAWLLESPGRTLFQVTGHPLMGLGPDGKAQSLDPSPSVTPASLLGRIPGDPPFNGWVDVAGRRCYLSWGAEGYRLVHPFSRPEASAHIENAELLETAVGATAPNVIYGPRGAGKSLLSALLAGRQCARGWRVMYVSCIPTHDLADGTTLLHEVVPPGAPAAHAREVFDRWRPDAVIIDMEPSEGVWGFARECHLAGVRLVLSLRAPDSQTARDRVRVVANDVSGWRFFSPWPVAPGPRLDVSLEAA